MRGDFDITKPLVATILTDAEGKSTVILSNEGDRDVWEQAIEANKGVLE